MQLKVFMVPVKSVEAIEPEMNALLRGHRVISVRKEFVSDGENSFWTFCVEYLNSAVPSGPFGGKGPKVDYREILKPAEFEVFSQLREWRKQVADKDGVPVYTIFSNEQLAEMVRRRTSSKAALKEIDGVGDARIEKYGEGPAKGHRASAGFREVPRLVPPDGHPEVFRIDSA